MGYATNEILSCIYIWIRESSIPVTCTAPNSSQDMLHIRVWKPWRFRSQCVLLRVTAQGFGRTPKWAGALEGLLDKAIPDQVFL